MAFTARVKHFARFANRATPKHTLRALSSTMGLKSSSPVISSLLAKQIPSSLVTTLPMAPSRTMSLFRKSPIELDDVERTLASRRDGVPEEEVTVDEQRPYESLLSNDDLDAILEQQHKRNRSVILQFMAEWCSPCHLLSRVLDAEMKKNPDLTLVKIDIDKAPEIAEQFEVRAVPTVVAIRAKKVTDWFCGSRDPIFVRDFLKRAETGEPPKSQ